MSAREPVWLSLNTEEGDIIRNINRVLNFMNKQAEGKNINLCCPPDSKPAKALFDAEKIERVLINLISNAVKFTPPSSNITITVNGTDNEVIITISDAGCGIPQEELSQIFDDFARAGAERKEPVSAFPSVRNWLRCTAAGYGRIAGKAKELRSLYTAGQKSLSQMPCHSFKRCAIFTSS